MGTNNYELGSGTLYFNGFSDPIDVSSASLEYTESSESVDEPIIIDCYGEFSCTASIDLDQYIRLVDYVADIMAELYMLCPNKRVAYLAFHAKKERARKKNFKRMVRIVEEVYGKS